MLSAIRPAWGSFPPLSLKLCNDYGLVGMVMAFTGVLGAAFERCVSAGSHGGDPDA